MTMNRNYMGQFNQVSGRLRTAIAFCTAACLGLTLPLGQASAQERWFEVEVSIFSNESIADRLEENWQPSRAQLSFPDSIRRLSEVNDIFLIDEFMPTLEEELAVAPIDDDRSPIEANALIVLEDPIEPTREELILQAILAVKPAPKTTGSPFKFPDLARDDYLRLPASFSDFTQTNRTIDRSPDHRLLWHGLWRQAVLPEAEAQAIYIAGGERYNERYELEGSLTIRFNDNADRVVIDSNLWLAEYKQSQFANSFEETQQAQNPWQIPQDLGEDFISKQQLLENSNELNRGDFEIERIYHMAQSRGMRSGEFHYLDHPAIGIVIMVNPYDVPPVSLPDESTLQEPGIIQ
jgi:hypothetical protein